MKLQASLVCVVSTILAGGLLGSAQDSHFNSRHNTLIADQFNNRVIEVDPNGKICLAFRARSG